MRAARAQQRTRVETAIRNQVNGVHSTEDELKAALKDWGLLYPDDAGLECWQVWRENGALPYAGGWLDQPAWVREDFRIYNLIESFHQLQAKKARTPTANPFTLFGKRGK